MIEIQCSCGNTWNYRGTSKRACCPSCGNKCTVSTHRTDEQRQGGKRGPTTNIELIKELDEIRGRYAEDLCKLSEARHEIWVLEQEMAGRSPGRRKSNEARLLDAIMEAPSSSNERVNRQLEAAQYLIKKMRRTRKLD